MVVKGICAVMVMFFDALTCLFSKKSIASISLWFLCIERLGLKLPNYKSHKLALNSLLFVMKSFCWVVFMKTLRFVCQSMAVVCRFHDVSIHAFSKKSIGDVFLFFFPLTDWNLNFQCKNGPEQSSLFWKAFPALKL